MQYKEASTSGGEAIEIHNKTKLKSTTRQNKMAIGRVIKEIDGVLFPGFDEIMDNIDFYNDNVLTLFGLHKYQISQKPIF